MTRPTVRGMSLHDSSAEQTSEQITLRLIGQEVELKLQPLESSKRRSDGQTLRRGTVNLVAGADLEDAVSDALRDAGGWSARTPLQDSQGTSWRVDEWDSSWRSDNGRDFTALLVEDPDSLTPTRLQFLDHDVAVEYYECDEPSSPDSILSLDVEFITGADETDRLIDQLGDYRGRNLAIEDPYFDFTRVGIPKTPQRFRFGLPIWQRLDEPENARRWHITFVAEDGDNADRQRGHNLGDPELSNTAQMTLTQRRQIEALLAELVAAGAITDEARERIMQSGRDALAGNDDLDLNQARDVTNYR